MLSGGLPINFATLTGNTFTIQTSDSTKLGTNTVAATYVLTKYPSITTTINFLVELFELTVSTGITE